MPIQRNVPYASGREADIFLAGTEAPWIVFLHGGGWISGDRSMYEEEAHLAVAGGLNAALVSYRLAPVHPFPAAPADVQSFLAWLHERHAPARVTLAGNSAGGHLACLVGMAEIPFGEAPVTRVDAVVGICPITDLTDPRARLDPISWGFVEQFLGDLGADSMHLRTASPIVYARAGTPPTLLVHGDADEIVRHDQSVALFHALRAADAIVELDVLQGEMHSFSFAAWEHIRSRMFDWALGRAEALH